MIEKSNQYFNVLLDHLKTIKNYSPYEKNEYWLQTYVNLKLGKYTRFTPT